MNQFNVMVEFDTFFPKVTYWLMVSHNDEALAKARDAAMDEKEAQVE